LGQSNLAYHGHGKEPPFFEGWYYKLVSTTGEHRYAIIPGVFLSRDPDRHHAFVQVLDGASGRSTYHRYPSDAFWAAEGELNLRIGPKIIIGYLLIILLMAAVAVVAYWGMLKITDANDRALERQANITDLWAMRSYMVEEYAEQADLIAHQEVAHTRMFQDEADSTDESEEIAHRELVREATDTEEERDWITEIEQLDSQFDSLFSQQIVPALQTGDVESVHSLEEQSYALMSQRQDLIENLINSFAGKVAQTHDTMENTYRQITLLMVLISVGAVLLLAAGTALYVDLCLWLFGDGSRALSRPAREVRGNPVVCEAGVS